MKKILKIIICLLFISTVFIALNIATTEKSLAAESCNLTIYIKSTDGRPVESATVTVGENDGRGGMVSGTERTRTTDALDGKAITVVYCAKSYIVNSGGVSKIAKGDANKVTIVTDFSGGTPIGPPSASKSVYISFFGRDFATISEFLQALFIWSTNIIGALAVLMIIYGGIRYITSSGNPDGIADAKNIIILALSAAALIVLARVIFTTVTGTPLI